MERRAASPVTMGTLAQSDGADANPENSRGRKDAWELGPRAQQRERETLPWSSLAGPLTVTQLPTPRERPHRTEDRYVYMYLHSRRFTTAQRWQQPSCPSTGGKISQPWPSRTLELSP